MLLLMSLLLLVFTLRAYIILKKWFRLLRFYLGLVYLLLLLRLGTFHLHILNLQLLKLSLHKLFHVRILLHSFSDIQSRFISQKNAIILTIIVFRLNGILNWIERALPWPAFGTTWPAFTDAIGANTAVYLFGMRKHFSWAVHFFIVIANV